MPKRSLKTDNVYRIICERIARGDYRHVDFPSERKLALQLGVSHPTARKAVQKAVVAGLLHRGETGRLLVPALKERNLQFAFICPAETDPWIVDWMKALQSLASRRSALLRVFHYLDGNDALLTNSLVADYDLYFLIAPDSPDRVLLDLIRDRKSRVVTIFSDLRKHGITMIDNSPIEGVDILIEHLISLGHRRIACVNCETHDMGARVARYEEVCARHGLEPLLLRESEPSEWISAARGYRFMSNVLKRQANNATAYFFTSVEPCLGVLRACYEANVVPGKDISICAFGPSIRARLMAPALTALLTPSHETVLNDVVDDILLGGGPPKERQWHTSLYLGETTAPAPKG